MSINTKYIITDNAFEISSELPRLANENATSSMFSCITHPSNGSTAISISNLDHNVLVHPNCEDSINRLKGMVSYDDDQKEALGAYILSIAIPQDPPEPGSGYILGRFPIRNIIEGFTTVYTFDEMVILGWFPE